MDAHTLECLDFPRVRELLAGYALTSLGRALAMSIHPIARVELVQRWLQQVDELQRLTEERGPPPFGGISDVRPVLERSGPPLRVTVEEIAQVASTLAGTHAVTEFLRDLPPDRTELRHLAGRVGDFQSIADRIRSVVDERGHVRDDASPKLASVRREIEQANQEISATIDRLLRDGAVRRLLQYPNHTYHGDRLVLPLRTEYRGRLPGIVHRASDSGATLYVEPAAIVELNNQISNLRSAEQEEIGRLLWELSHEIHVNAREIYKTLDTLAVLDLIAAKVRFARDFELRCPAIRADGILNVRAARHPLLIDLNRRRLAAGEPPQEVVPIDYRLGQDFSLLIITGPNTGGKTVTLKTIGLLCLLVQAGLPVPVAAGSELPVFTNILVDIGDEQSLQQSLSTFSAHLTRIVDMLRHAGPHALLLMDELGAGTDPDEGAALGRAILDELLRQKCRAVVTTHLGALKGFALARPGAENGCVDFDTNTLRPTFRLRLGEPGQSNALEVAQHLGMPKRLLLQARRNLSRGARVLHAALEGTRVVKRQAEQARQAADSARLEASQAQSEAHAARAQYEQKQSDFQRWLQRVVHLRPGDPVRVRDFDHDGKIVRLRLDQHRAEIDVGAFSVDVPLGDVLPPQTPPPPPRPPRPATAPPTTPSPPRRSAARPAAHVPPDAPRPARPPHPDGTAPGHPDRREGPARPAPNLVALTPLQAAALQPMDTVYVKTFQREGRVVRVQAGKQIVIVTVGVLEVAVPFSGLARVLELERPRPARRDPPRATPDAPGAAPPPAPTNAAEEPPPAPQPPPQTDALPPPPAA